MKSTTRRAGRVVPPVVAAAVVVLAAAGSGPAGIGGPPPTPGMPIASPYPHRASAVAAAAVRDADGRIVTTGQGGVAAGPGGVLLARFSGDGMPDASFGTGGVAIAPGAAGRVVSTLPDGRILVGGWTSAHGTVARFSATGDRDPTFGVGGTYPGDASPSPYVYTLAATPLPDGTIVAVFAGGQYTMGTGPAPGGLELTRLSADGRLISRATYSEPEWTQGELRAYASWTAAHVYLDGAVLVAGSRSRPCADASNCPSRAEMLLRRFRPDGSLDGSFGTAGRVTAQIGSETYALALHVGGDGTIVVGGAAGGSVQTFAAARFHADGKPDLSFGDRGAVAIPGGYADAIGVAADGRVFLGSRQTGDAVVLELGPTGAPVATFGTGGRATVPGGGQVGALLADADGGVTVVVSTFSTGTTGLVRYGPDGRPGPATPPAPLAAPSQGLTSIASAGSTVAAAGWIDGSDGRRGVHVLLLRDSRPVGTFGDGGEVTVPAGERSAASSVALDASGRVVAGGEVTVGGALRPLVLRLRADGSLDPAFASGGMAVPPAGRPGETVADVAVLAAGGLLLLLRGPDGVALVRLTPGGATDTGFGAAGRTELPLPGAATLASTTGGRAVVTGDGLAAVEVDTAGAVVSRLGPAVPGAVATGSATQRDGSVVAVGAVPGGMAMTRRTGDGGLDPAFGSGGVVTRAGVTPADVTIQEEGRIAVAVREPAGAALAVAQFLYDGRVDETFGTGGVARAQAGTAAAVTETFGSVVVAGSAPSLRGSDASLTFLLEMPRAARPSSTLRHALVSGASRAVGPGTDPAWSPQARLLAYVGADGWTRALFVRGKTGAPRLLATSPLPGGLLVSGRPQWSRDGTMLAVELVDPDGAPSVGVVRLADGTVRRVDGGSSAAWLDGHRLAYAVQAETTSSIRIADADTGATRRLTTGWSVSTARRGTLLAVARADGWVLVRDDGRLVRRLPPRLRDVQWAPDGTRLAAFDRRRLAVVDLRGRERLLAAVVGAEARMPTWSPDGRTIAFVNRLGQYTVTFVDVRSGRVVGRYAPGTGFAHSNPTWDATGVIVPTGST